MYDEAGDQERLFGTVILAASTILGLGIVVVLVVVGLQGILIGASIAAPEAIGLLAILVLLAPLQALDDLEVALLAVFARPRAIFVRRYVLTPVLRIVVVLLLVASGGPVTTLAVGYVAAGAIGVVVYGVILVRLLLQRGLHDHVRRRAIRVPVRDLFGFALPLLSTDILYIFLATSDVILLGAFHTASDVAALRSVQPVAALNQVVFMSFTLLYTPIAARLFARGDREGIRNLYWDSAIWIAVLTLPVFVVTFALAEPVTLLLFGRAYAGSGTYLAILAVGYYVNAALGFNGLTLKVHGHVGTAVVIDLVAAFTNVAVNIVLVPPLGPLGASIGTCTTLLLHNALKQVALQRRTGIDLFDRRGAPVYGAILLAVAGVGVVEAAAGGGLVLGIALSAGASLAVVTVSRRRLRVADSFPEILRIPILGRLLA
jgi:O-antigen/teichoic acid export membrane protein